MQNRNIYLLLLIGFFIAVAAGQLQHHPFSEIGPADDDLEFEGFGINDSSHIETDDIVARDSNLTIHDSGEGDTDILVYDSNNPSWRMKLPLKMEEGNIEDVNCIGDEC